MSFQSPDASWCASFRAGAPLKTGTAVVVDDYAVILAGGVCYCVDLERQTVRLTLPSWYTDAIAIPDTGMAAVADFNGVTVIDGDGVKWTSPRLAWDGVRFTGATRSAIFGIAETGHGPPDDRPFEIDLLRRHVTGGYVHAFRS